MKSDGERGGERPAPHYCRVRVWIGVRERDLREDVCEQKLWRKVWREVKHKGLEKDMQNES